MRKITELLHMLVYSLLWGALIGFVAAAIPVTIAGGLSYLLIYGLVGLMVGAVSGAIAGLLTGIVTCVYFWPPQNETQYKYLMCTSFVLIAGLSCFVISYLQFIGPIRDGGQYVDPVQTMALSVVIPSIVMALLCIPLSLRLIAWYIARDKLIKVGAASG